MGWRSENRIQIEGTNFSTSNFDIEGDSDWHHWAFVYDDSAATRTLYRDGVIVSQQFGAISTVIDPQEDVVFIGANRSESADFGRQWWGEQRADLECGALGG